MTIIADKPAAIVPATGLRCVSGPSLGDPAFIVLRVLDHCANADALLQGARRLQL